MQGPGLSDISELLSRVEGRLVDVAATGPEPVDAASAHLIEAGGKRARPRVLLITSQVGGAPVEDRWLVDLAAAGELVHSASLLHDDVIDDADLRRGLPTARQVWGNAQSVLAGDHLLINALDILDDVPVDGVLKSMLTTIRRLVAAEVVQLAHRGKLLPDMDHYYKVVRGKTAALFAWCADAGARAGGAEDHVARALYDFGEEVGVAFQLKDDLLDLAGSSEELGKSLLTDLKQGVATLPVVLAAERHPELAESLAERFARADGEKTNGIAEMVPMVQAWVRETGAEDRTREIAMGHVERARKAIAPLEDMPIATTLDALALSMVDRRL